jgi:CRISPR-associated endoribonuclease Cas6
MNMEQKLIFSTVVKLQARQSGRLPATIGRLAHGAFFEMIKSVDPDLSATLHDIEQKPFTVSPLYGLEKARGQASVRMGQEVWLRFTLLQSELFMAFTQYLLAPQRVWPTLQLGDIEFLITETLTTPDSHEWAGYLDLNSVEVHASEGLPPDEITLEFASPTVFNRGKKEKLGRMMDPFPLPDLVFGGLAKRWQKYLPGLFEHGEVREYAQETVVIGLYKMESKVNRYLGNPQIGSVGRVTYLLKDKTNLPMLHQLNLLADMSFYSGVGYKTTMGMGQVRRVNGEL